MATRQLLAELVTDYKKSANADIHIESVGGPNAPAPKDLINWELTRLAGKESI